MPFPQCPVQFELLAFGFSTAFDKSSSGSLVEVNGLRVDSTSETVDLRVYTRRLTTLDRSFIFMRLRYNQVAVNLVLTSVHLDARMMMQLARGLRKNKVFKVLVLDDNNNNTVHCTHTLYSYTRCWYWTIMNWGMPVQHTLQTC
jgi:hypothetical protein